MPPWQLFAAALADLAFGDPQWIPHPVRLFGALITLAEKLIRKIARSNAALFSAGAMLTLVLTIGVAIGTWQIIKWLHNVSPVAATIITIYLAYSTLSVRGLDDAGTAVVTDLRNKDIAKARTSLSQIVGRDTNLLDEPEILRAVTETIAENCSDAVVAPLFYLALGGVPAALAYKAINTLDSMIGTRTIATFTSASSPPASMTSRISSRLG